MKYDTQILNNVNLEKKENLSVEEKNENYPLKGDAEIYMVILLFYVGSVMLPLFCFASYHILRDHIKAANIGLAVVG